jgi:uncharacterized repeat protein (TIGR01451 family)
MEYSTTPAAPRRLIRRLIPWTVSLGLFAGGGYGVYTYAVPKPADATTDEAASTADPFAAKPSSTAKEQINQLFASSSAPSTPSDAYANRYATSTSAAGYSAAPTPQLPPAQEPEQDEVATPRSAAAVTAQNPFSTAPVGGYADRYGAPTPASVPPSTSPIGVGAAAAPASEPALPIEPAQTVEAVPASGNEPPAEVTRGQEPADANPLRAAASRPAEAAGSTEARAAFGAAESAGGTGGGDAPARLGVSGAEPTSPSYSNAAQAFAAPNRSASAEAGQYAAAESAHAEPTLAPTPANSFAGAAPLASARQQAPTFAADVQQAPPTRAIADMDADITPTPGILVAEGAGTPGERLLEGQQNPAITIQKLAPPEIQVGKKCTFAVRVTNTSQHSAHNVQIRDEVPKGTQMIGSAPKANVSGTQVVWDLGTMSPGDERIVEMELLPTEEGDLGSVATVTFAAQASAKSRCTKPQLALRLTAGPRVMIGEQHIVQIEVANPGTGDATGVMLLETVPAGVSHEAGPALEFEVGTLRPGESKQLDLVLTAEEAGRITNAMTARADANLEVEAMCDFEVIAPDLKVSVEGPKQRYLERPATYTVSVDNPGTASAKEVQLITKLPPGLQFVSANNMGEYDATTHSVHWSLAELPANERGTVELTALPVEAGEHTLQVASRAEQGLEDRTEAHVKVEGLVALSFEVEAADGAVEVGGETAYDVTVVNQGSKAATNVQVVAAIPQGLRATNGQGATRHVVEGDKVVFAPLAQLAPKAEAKFRVQVQGLRAGDLRTKIMVTADEVQEPITKEQSTHVYADQ